MFGIKKNIFILPIIFLVVFMTGCTSSQSPAEKMYDVLEKVVSLEKGFEDQQDPLVSLEKKEKDIYNQIIGLGMKEYDQIVKLSDKALTMADKRKEYMEKETKSIKASEEEFKKITELKNEFDDEKTAKLADDLYNTMMERYKAHDILYKEYLNGLKYDKELYEMFKNKDVPLEDLETQVTKLNDSYKKVFAANESFNKLTEQYNEKKVTFYKQAGLKLKNE